MSTTDASADACADPLSGLRTVWQGWDVIRVVAYSHFTGSAEDVEDLTGAHALLVVLKRRENRAWATTVLALSDHFEEPHARVVHSWADWTPSQRADRLHQSVGRALVAEDGLADLVDSVGLWLEDTVDPVARTLFPLDYNAVLLLTLDPHHPALDPDASVEVEAVQTLAGLGGFNGLARALL